MQSQNKFFDQNGSSILTAVTDGKTGITRVTPLVNKAKKFNFVNKSVAKSTEA